MTETAAVSPAVSSPSAALAEFAAGLTFADLPADVVAHTKVALLDTLGCGIFGASLEWTRILRRTLAGLETAGDCALIGSSARLSGAHAVLVNGAAIHGFELDDLHARSIVHPGSVVLPAALAAAQRNPAIGGRELLVALVAGYEVAARVGMSVGAAHLLRGFHPTGTHGTVGAAAAAGSVLGLSAERMTHALGIAGTQAAGLMSAQYASMVKRFHAGRAAQSGYYAACLAGQGYTGITGLLDEEYGAYGTTLSPTFDRDVITAGLGETWEVRSVGFKPYSTNGSCHPAIDAVLDLRAEHGIRFADVAEVRLRVSSATYEHVGWPYEPGSVTTAQMNLPYIMGVAFADGDAFVRQFTPERITDPRLVEFTRRVTVTADPAIDAEGDKGRHHTLIEVVLADGRVFADDRRFARGSARRPMSPAEVEQKFDKLAGGLIDDASAARVKEIVSGLDEQPDLTGLLDALGQDVGGTAYRI